MLKLKALELQHSFPVNDHIILVRQFSMNERFTITAKHKNIGCRWPNYLEMQKNNDPQKPCFVKCNINLIHHVSLNSLTNMFINSHMTTLSRIAGLRGLLFMTHLTKYYYQKKQKRTAEDFHLTTRASHYVTFPWCYRATSVSLVVPGYISSDRACSSHKTWFSSRAKWWLFIYLKNNKLFHKDT